MRTFVILPIDMSIQLCERSFDLSIFNVLLSIFTLILLFIVEFSFFNYFRSPCVFFSSFPEFLTLAQITGDRETHSGF